jgi:SAM-dependent methyltransferase
MAYQHCKKIAFWFKRHFQQRFGVIPLAESQTAISQWFDLPLGQRILAAQQCCLDKIMPNIYGYHLLQLSVLNNVALSRQSPVTHHFSLGVRAESDAKALARFEQLPIEADSIDAVILHHSLEYSTNPHQLLREAARTIIPNGYIIIVGFNPWALLTIRKHWCRLFSHNKQCRYHSLRRSRVLDWLKVLDFDPVLIQYGEQFLPFQNLYHQGTDKVFTQLFPAGGSFYTIVARKSVLPMTPVKQAWRKKSTFPLWSKGSTVSGKTVFRPQLKANKQDETR